MGISRCKCGKRKSSSRNECTTCHKANMDQIHLQAQKTVTTGECPNCGKGLKRNLAIAGWHQCEQYGNSQFRKDPSLPSCSFQCFTE